MTISKYVVDESLYLHLLILLQPVGKHISCCGRRYEARTVRRFQTCVLNIARRGRLQCGEFNFGSGFALEFVYAKDVKLGRDVIGLSDDWSLSPSLARFFSLNQDLISSRIRLVEQAIQNFREYHRRQYLAKTETLRYSFLMTIYNEPQEHEDVIKRFEVEERDLRVRSLPIANEAAFVSAYERFMVATSSEANAWWYILWVCSSLFRIFRLLNLFRMICGGGTTILLRDF